ncbi:MAG: 6-carboxytetrahydropterin synthase [Haloquadratum sp.]|jgi:6-pyruvoyltetrahydropterin/6-carboxytetrahydropterin synthase|nr:6-carboxytetrahydropterin synthase [Haloferacaceae archaeon]MDR9445280.1 6-carboxytetrahydropterin synthase [Haloquadratum sp.]
MHEVRRRYTLRIERELIAQHYLTVPDPGPEGQVHSHRYTIGVTLLAEELDPYGYVVDIDAFTEWVEAVADRYRDTLLNDHTGDAATNPSVEWFATQLADAVAERVTSDRIVGVELDVHEDAIASVRYRRAV